LAGSVLGFRVTSYVADELIDWPAGPDDPIYRLVFPAEDTLDMAAGIARAQQIFGGAYSGVSGLARTVRGPAMHDEHGIVCLDRTAEVGGQKLFVLRYLQARDPSLAGAPFFAAFSTHAAWLTDLEPVPGMRPPRRPPRRTRALADGIREFPTSHPFN